MKLFVQCEYCLQIILLRFADKSNHSETVCAGMVKCQTIADRFGKFIPISEAKILCPLESVSLITHYVLHWIPS